MKKILVVILAIMLLSLSLISCDNEKKEFAFDRELASLDEISTEVTDDQFYQFQIDINPSITLTYNEEGYIVYAFANNDDATNLLNNVDLIGLSVEDAFTCAALKSYELGYDTDDFDIDVKSVESNHTVGNKTELKESIKKSFEKISEYIPVKVNDEINEDSLTCEEAKTDKDIEEFFSEEYEEIYRAKLAGYYAKFPVNGVPKVCEVCNGEQWVTCPTCNGEGEVGVTCPICNGEGKVEKWVVCSYCSGTGKDVNNMQATGEVGSCPRCNNYDAGCYENPGYEKNHYYGENGSCEYCHGTGNAYTEKCETCKDPYGESTGRIICDACNGNGTLYITEYYTDWISLDYYQMLINDGADVEILEEYYD